MRDAELFLSLIHIFTNDYEILTKSRAVLETVIENLNLNLGYEQLNNMVSISNPEDSRIMEITLTYPDPEEAKAIVDEIASVTSEFIGDQMEGIPPKIIDQGEVPSGPSSPSVSRNTLLGILLGIVVSCGIITVITVDVYKRQLCFSLILETDSGKTTERFRRKEEKNSPGRRNGAEARERSM